MQIGQTLSIAAGLEIRLLEPGDSGRSLVVDLEGVSTLVGHWTKTGLSVTEV